MTKITGLESRIQVRGRGLIYGIDMNALNVDALNISKRCFESRLFIENVGRNVLKVLPPLMMEEKLIEQGVDIIYDCIKQELV